MKKPEDILLVVDDNRDVLIAVEMLTKKHFREVITSPTPEVIPSLLRKHRPDVVLLDMNFRSSVNSGNEGLYWLREIRRISPSTRIVLFTAYADVALAVQGMKEGAADFIVKPFDNEKLLASLCTPKSTVKPTQPVAPAFAPSTPHEALINKVAPTDANILITGENGTGKEVMAREIHRLSMRNRQPMIAVDMGALTESLFESELFGYVKGAFTDAKADHPGKFEAADGGTLFLDEIGNLSLAMQAKLLRALQQKHIVRVGDNHPIPVDFRLICATNQNLPQMVKEGTFREDLYFRINTIHIELPALRDRQEDIPTLAEHFISKYAAQYGKPLLRLAEADIRLLQQQPWPGNIRELEHVIEKAVILGSLRLSAPQREEAASAEDDSPATLADMERKMIEQAINQFDGNLSLAAQQLGITRQTLYNKLKRYGL